jgi:hypothetical protein
MVRKLKEASIKYLGHIKGMALARYPTQSPEFEATKGLAIPKEAMYIHCESSAQAVAAFPSPSLAINQTDVIQRKGWRLKVSPRHKTLPPLPAFFPEHHPHMRPLCYSH